MTYLLIAQSSHKTPYNSDLFMKHLTLYYIFPKEDEGWKDAGAMS
jgi:hypothetical protein